ncbi:GNAT family N-acetyltransferase [Methylocystis echinoides]|jgi:RimJ/RimL family protein N-acetyltransferase|uniref:N-acetyltransferase n=1 Tax=Methylocystis echinoides TaxID=29468 RepID=A0A9W6GXF6_9HYPH|nr:GNAT family N-acetyltransferase [Methylocystis echinoides]GLI94772.1 N-acetyltransferase [Methylocystis echinoides]
MFPEITHDDIFRLETERMWLRWPRLADAEAFTRLAGDPEVAVRTANIPHPYNLRDAEQFIRRARAENESGQGLVLALTAKATPNEPIGVIGAHGSDFRGTALLGYWLGRPFWGQGLMTEAARGFVDLIFGVTSLGEIVCDALPDNLASRRVQEKLGFASLGAIDIEAPARGGRMRVERTRLSRGAAHTAFGAKRPKFTST